MLQTLRCPETLQEYWPNLGTLLLRNQAAHGENPACAERDGQSYRYWSWKTLVEQALVFAKFLGDCGLHFESGTASRVAFLSANSRQRLVCEMAVMASGLTSVPIFADYAPRLTAQLLEFSRVDLLVTDDAAKLAQLPRAAIPGRVVLLDGQAQDLEWLQTHGPRRQYAHFEAVLAERPGDTQALAAMRARWKDVVASTRALIMYTSGTSGFPKGVQLSHANLLSQQQALRQLWQPESGMRFLCYLPWHHSFGGLFERLFALSSGGCLAIDDSRGKDLDRLLENFMLIRPHIYFSVPKIYQEIITRVLRDATVCDAFFHADLKFVFTAAAPLPLATSDVFKARGVPVVEGWGLTETSPCCTLTELSLQRQQGVVGVPIPGVEVALAADHEILVKGPNVTAGYFRNPQATLGAFDVHGWFKTGDIGDITPDGVKIISRKERMFKLSNGEKIFPAQIEEQLYSHCKFVKYAYVFGAGLEHPCLLLFPNSEMLTGQQNKALDHSDCAYPRSLDGLAACLGCCIAELQDQRGVRFEKLDAAVLVDRELSLENDELTPSFKLIPRRIERHYAAYIEAMQEQRYEQLPEDAHVVQLSPREVTT